MRNDGEPLNVRLDLEVTLPSAGMENRMALRREDWKRIKKRLKRCRRPEKTLTVAYSLLYGFAASTLITLIGLWASPTPSPAWIYWVYIGAMLGTTFTGVVLNMVEKRLHAERMGDLDDAIEDMEEIELLLLPGGAPPKALPPPEPTDGLAR